MFDAIYQYLYRIDLHERLIVAIELILIGGFVYTVISFLEGTRGERLFRGVIFILIVGSLILNFVAREVGLLRIAYLYKGFLLAVLIVAVAAFQPEIRRALIRIGQAGFLSSSPQQLTRSVEEIINAVTQLAATRTGAIIVIEQQVSRSSSRPARIDAKVTAELLKTIFYPGSALHDMAVVIQGDRIVAARVQLPLAEGELQGRQLGSRHSRAVGVTTVPTRPSSSSAKKPASSRWPSTATSCETSPRPNCEDS